MSNYKPKEFAEMIGVSVKTLQRWDREGVLKAYRTPKDRRYYTDKQYAEYIQARKDKKQGKLSSTQEFQAIIRKMTWTIRLNF